MRRVIQVRTVRCEVTDRMLITGPRHLRAALDRHAAYHNPHCPAEPATGGHRTVIDRSPRPLNLRFAKWPCRTADGSNG